MDWHVLFDSPWACAAIILIFWSSAYGVYKFCTGDDARAAGVRYRDDEPPAGPSDPSKN